MRERGKRRAEYVPDYTVFDLETTGLCARTDDIIEISAVRVRGGKIAETYSALVDPGRPIPARATAVNGITDDMVKGAPRIKEAMEAFCRFIGDDILVGHNIAAFDMKFLYEVSEKIFGDTIPNDFVDTLYMARTCLPELKHHRLVDLAEYFGIRTEGAHRALWDCMMNQKCFEQMAALPKETLLCPKCGAQLVKRSGRYGQFWGCSGFPNCRYTQNIR